MVNSEEYEALRERQRVANEMFERLMAAPPSVEELTLQELYPRTPRERIVRMVVSLYEGM